MLACAFCPTCLATYAKVLSAVGVGVGLSEAHHEVLLVLAVALSLAVSGYRSFRGRRAWPVLVSIVGCAAIVAGHAMHGGPLEVLGMIVLVVGGIAERRTSKQPSDHASLATFGVGEESEV
ncbi:MAG: hypothetical protein ACXVEE_22095 [Polyangiales bacterium]